MIELPAGAGGRRLYLTFPFPTDRIQEGLDVLEPMWYDHGVGQVRAAFEWTRAITARVKCRFAPLFLGQGREFYYTGGDPGEVLRAMNWAALLGGADGYGYWLTEFSPLQLSWLARTNREAAVVEDILLDGAPDPADVTLEPLPQRHVLHRAGQTQWTQAVPDFAADGLWRGSTLGNRRLVGMINLDRGLDAYARLKVAGLPTGRYTVVDVSEQRGMAPAAGRLAFAADELRAGIVVSVPPRCGVRLLEIAPEAELAPPAGEPILAPEIAAAYEQYRRPDTEESVLAQRGKLSIAYGLAPGGQAALVIESPAQQVAVRPEDGGAIVQWRAKDPPQPIGTALGPQDGIALDLFWGPPDAHWSGDEKSAYEVVAAKIHGSKAYLTLRQKKQSPALNGLMLTKTIVVAEGGTDVQVLVDIENPGPAPVASFAYWVHHVFRLSDQAPEIVMPTAAGPLAAPLGELVWAKPDEPFIAGNEQWERGQRNGTVTGEWIAQRDPGIGNAVLCQNEGPPVAQFYSWRDAQRPDNLSVEWMHRLVKLEAGRHWTTRYTLRYLPGVKTAELPSRLLRAPE
ncbi:MAG: hypothetical protein HYU66_11685 [Armatimonadetes bacterium]|nr:hypothetical protein [Armatimonadota bacterium]